MQDHFISSGKRSERNTLFNYCFLRQQGLATAHALCIFTKVPQDSAVFFFVVRVWWCLTLSMFLHVLFLILVSRLPFLMSCVLLLLFFVVRFSKFMPHCGLLVSLCARVSWGVPCRAVFGCLLHALLCFSWCFVV